MLCPKCGWKKIDPSINDAYDRQLFHITGSYKLYSPQAVVAAGHYQRAISVKMDLKAEGAE